MSRFSDKLKNALQVAPPAMGFFNSARISSKPKMLAAGGGRCGLDATGQ